MTPNDPLADARLFRHEAMRTEFTFRFRGLSDVSAPGIARLCIETLDTLESQLSRFIDGSDISRINQMRAGETLYLSEAVHQCLLLALDACSRTHGLFDITQGSRIEHLKSGQNQPAPEISGSLTIHPDVPAVTCKEPGRVLDLGGIGKGFALDQLKLLLTDWGVDDALLAADSATPTLPWFAGYASIVAAEFHRRANDSWNNYDIRSFFRTTSGVVLWTSGYFYGMGTGIRL